MLEETLGNMCGGMGGIRRRIVVQHVCILVTLGSIEMCTVEGSDDQREAVAANEAFILGGLQFSRVSVSSARDASISALGGHPDKARDSVVIVDGRSRSIQVNCKRIG